MRSGRTNPWLFLLAAVLAAGMQATIAGSMQGQEPTTSFPGARVRVTLRDRPDRWLIGTVVGQSGDSLRLDERDSHAMLAVPTERLAALQVSRGRHSHAALGALIGLAAGVAFGLIATAADPAIDTDARGYALVAGIFGGMGAGAGALVGWAVRCETWEPLSPPHTISRTVPASATRRPVLGLSLQF